MNEDEPNAIASSTIRQLLASVGHELITGQFPIMLDAECEVRLGVPLDTTLGDLTDEQGNALLCWLRELVAFQEEELKGLEALWGRRKQEGGA